MNPQMERKLAVDEVLATRLPLELIEVVEDYAVPSLHEIWFELALEHKKKRRISTTITPRRNPDRLVRKKYA